MVELKRVPLDELELHLNLLKANTPEDINNATCKEIIGLLETNFGITCMQEEIFLLHEPSIPIDRLAIEIHYRALGLI